MEFGHIQTEILCSSSIIIWSAVVLFLLFNRKRRGKIVNDPENWVTDMATNTVNGPFEQNIPISPMTQEAIKLGGKIVRVD
jgi:hypothetical protein